MTRRNPSRAGAAKEVEYLGSDKGMDTHTKMPIVVVTLRLDPDEGFCPSNLILSISQAERLRNDLNRMFKTP